MTEKRSKYYLCIRDNPAGGMTYCGEIRSGSVFSKLAENRWFRLIEFAGKLKLGQTEDIERLANNARYQYGSGEIPVPGNYRGLYYMPRRQLFIGLTLELGADIANAAVAEPDLAERLYHDLSVQFRSFPYGIPDIFTQGMRGGTDATWSCLLMMEQAERARKQREEFDALGIVAFFAGPVRGW